MNQKLPDPFFNGLELIFDRYFGVTRPTTEPCRACGSTVAHYCMGKKMNERQWPPQNDPGVAQSQQSIPFQPGRVTQKRIDDRINGCDEERNRIRDLQAKGPLTEGERMELHVLLQRRYPARPPVATY